MEEVDSEANCWLRKGGAEIHLLEPLEELPDQINASSYSSRDLAQGNTSHVAFEVDDLNEAQRHLNTYHIEIVCGPRPRLKGGEQLYICDPDGYVIELFT